MSAICGIVSFDGAPVETELLQAMAAAAAHFEPVEIGCQINGSFGFSWAARRHAPSRRCARQGSLALICEARLDNRQALRQALDAQQAVLGSPPTDAELLLAAYVTWGAQCHRHLRGAFVAAIWDSEARQLFLIRDPAGERALYWHRSTEALVFASEPVQLLACGRLRKACDQRRILAHLLGSLPDLSWSFFDQVSRLPEGHHLLLSPTRSHLQRYWDWASLQRQPRDPQTAPGELLSRLQTAVKCRLASDGETGILLSGGLDSSSVAVEAAELLQGHGRRLHAFTWASESGDGIDERDRSSMLLAERPGLKEYPIEADDLWPLSRYPDAYVDVSDPQTNAYPDLLLTTLETARQAGVTVLLNGIGGDPAVGWTTPDLALLLAGRIDLLWQRWRRAGVRQPPVLKQLWLTQRRVVPQWLTPQARGIAREAGLLKPAIDWRALTSRTRFRAFALSSYVNAATLERFERWGRRTGVRTEAPWHDPELGALALSLPGCAVDPGPTSKSLVRAAMQGRLPERLRRAPGDKRAFSQLGARGLLRAGAGTVRQLLSSSRLHDLGLIDAGLVVRRYEDLGKRNQRLSRLWELLTTEAWLRLQ